MSCYADIKIFVGLASLRTRSVTCVQEANTTETTALTLMLFARYSIVAKHLKNIHTHQSDLVNQVRGCHRCGSKNVLVQMLAEHQGCGVEKMMEVNCATDNDPSNRLPQQPMTTMLN